MVRVVLAVSLCLPQVALAVPMQFVQQGRLLDAAGDPYIGEVSTTFSLHTTAAGGLAEWSETQAVQYVSGHYTAILGDGTLLDTGLFASGEPLYLELALHGAPLTPRTPLASVPFAVAAASADTLSDATCQDGEVLRFDGDAFACADQADHAHDRLPADGGVLVTDAPTCSEPLEGLLRYDAAAKRLEICDGENWNVVYSLGPPRDCREQLEIVPTSLSGTYPVDPDGDGTTISVYCDMDYDQGGWTRVVAHDVASEGTTFATHAAKWDAVDAGMGRFSCSGSGVISYANIDPSNYPMQFYSMDLTPFATAREVRFVHNDSVVSWDGALLARVRYADSTVDTRIYDNNGCSIPTGACSGSENNRTYDDTEAWVDTGRPLSGFEWGVKTYQGGCGDYHQIRSYTLYIR